MTTHVEHNNFIGVYDGFFSDEFCDNLIAYFEWSQATNKTFGRPDEERFKKDTTCNLNPTSPSEISLSYGKIGNFLKEFNDIFWQVCYKDYVTTYSTLSACGNHTIFTYKLQKTEPGGGYHVWHFENDSKVNSSRIGAYMIYLNDVQEGGETEFLYQSRRIAAKKGRLVIFPSNYPWTHRGNPPLAITKYILTGWTEYA